MATATQALSLNDAIEIRRKMVRSGEYNEKAGVGGYRVLGRLIELRHERAVGGETPGRDVTDKVGLVMDWKHFHNGPLIALDRSRTQLLVISQVGPLPPIPDPNWQTSQFVKYNGNWTPLASIPEEMRKTLKNSDGSSISGIDAVVLPAPMVKQSFLDHASGCWGDFLRFSPLTQALYKIDGVVGFALIRFASSVGLGDSPTFLLNPANGEGHFLGGQFFLE